MNAPSKEKDRDIRNGILLRNKEKSRITLKKDIMSRDSVISVLIKVFLRVKNTAFFEGSSLWVIVSQIQLLEST